MGTVATLLLLKQNGQDYEWYPTTDAMIDVVFRNCEAVGSMLDIGAGDGRVLETFDKLTFQREAKGRGWTEFVSTVDKYAIEKSTVHIENMPPDISIVGTDFRHQTLIDKKVDLIFCNPPYSEYEDWAVQIIKEANANTVFLVIPQRWQQSKLIEQAIALRKATQEVIWSGAFADADRRARAKVDIVKITLVARSYGGWEREDTDPFDVWFSEYFSGFEAIDATPDEIEESTASPLRELVPGQNLVERLAELYVADLNHLLGNYKTLSALDIDLLKEIGVSVSEIRKALKQKIEGLKNKYWQELFGNLDKVTHRLTSESRKAMLEKLHASCNVDFTVENAYAVVLWVIKNANKYIDQQLVEVFKELSEPECVKNYKSNIKTWERNDWRYTKDHTHYTLDYRIVSQHHCAIDNSTYSWGSRNGMTNNCHDFINDIFTIANNLGFSNSEDSRRVGTWRSNGQKEFYTNGGEILAEIRAFKNGNVHLKLNQEFIKTLNVEASRLLGWIKTPEEAVEEMGLDIEFVRSRLNSNLLFGISDGRKLLTA